MSEAVCSVCGWLERKYKPPKNVDFVCSRCVQEAISGHKPQSESLDFKRGYIRALFLENERWTDCIEKYWMIVPGDPLNGLHRKRDQLFKEKLADQVHPDTYEDRKAYFKAWLEAECCADDCDKYCDECPGYKKHGIHFKPVPYRLSKEFDPDVRRFMEKYQRFWLKSEESKALKVMKGGAFYDIKREVPDRKIHDDSLRVRGGKSAEGLGLPGEQEKVTGNSFEGQEEMFLRP